MVVFYGSEIEFGHHWSANKQSNINDQTFYEKKLLHDPDAKQSKNSTKYHKQQYVLTILL